MTYAAGDAVGAISDLERIRTAADAGGFHDVAETAVADLAVMRAGRNDLVAFETL